MLRWSYFILQASHDVWSLRAEGLRGERAVLVGPHDYGDFPAGWLRRGGVGLEEAGELGLFVTSAYFLAQG